VKPQAMWHIEDALRTVLPTLLALLLVLVAVVPYGLPRLDAVMPWLGLMPIYYWSIHEPRAMPLWAAFGIGLWQDLMTGGPIGLFALVFLLVRHLVVSQRLVFYKKPFFVGWWGFGLVSALAALSGWVIAALYDWALLPALPFVMQGALSILLYPIVAWIMGGLWLLVGEG